MHTAKKLSMLGLVLASGVVTGCGMFDNDSDRDHDRSVRHDDRYDRDYDRGRTAGEKVERDLGTSRQVPRDARVVEEGRGAQSFTAPRSGSVYVEDYDANTVVWDGKVREGDRVTVVPEKNRISINGKDQTSIDLKADHRFRVYFLER